MKPIIPTRSLTTSFLETIAKIWFEWRRQKLPLYLFLGMVFNLLVLSPAVYAATGAQLTQSQIVWLAMLGMVTVALSIYLFFVMFVPEKF
ncbi:potassium-transporting ATPase subunit F [Leptothermofonsia sp. ETS-13]|uniref:potassium-transporting ATPase subunit F n=1 Tax=Leptothermofonsia sp. ETS-13 TaxID=3035696 RepID=UPI003BA3DB3D